MIRRLLPLFACAILLPGCGLRPVYSGGANSAVANVLNSVEVGPIDGKAGWIMTQQLKQRLASVPAGSGAYRLNIDLNDQLTSFGISLDNSVSRERRTLRAHYTLLDNATDEVLLEETASAEAGIDLTQSDYATIAAEDMALDRLSIDLVDQITTRLALFAKRPPAKQHPSAQQ
jgi:LPS-assembly lipoprotein